MQFRRQYPIDSYIVDFAAPSIKLVIEVDGDTHANVVNQLSDTFRTDHLTSLGYRVVRFTNSDVLTNITSVLDKIQNSIPDPP